MGASPGRLIAMTAAHDAFRRDLGRISAAATPANLQDPARRASILAGWQLFTAQLHIHHGAEDRVLWPLLRQRLAGSPAAMSILDQMDAEHARIEPLLAAVDEALAGPRAGAVTPAVEQLAVMLRDHLAHEESDAMPLVNEALSEREWRTAVGQIHALVKSIGSLSVADFVPWLTDGVSRSREAQITTILPAPIRPLYRWLWKPRYARTMRW